MCHGLPKWSKHRLGKSILVGLFLTILGGDSGNAQARCAGDTRTEDLAMRFVISAGSISMPVGAFLLVRKDRRIGAIRLTGIDPTGTEWLGKSKWESFFQPDGSALFLANNVVRHTGELDVRSPKGVHSLYSYGAGYREAHIGKWTFSFGGPALVRMSGTGAGDHGYEYAPTSACELSEVDVHDGRLRWFRFDRNSSVNLPLADLPK